MATIALVEPRAPSYHIFSHIPLPRLGLPLIGTVLRNLGHEVTVYCQGLGPFPLKEILKADVVGISTTTSTAPEGYRLADACRSRGVRVMLGGVHASFCPQEALQHADAVCLGEAEEVVGEVVERLLSQPAGTDGFLWPERGQLCRAPDLDRLPMPDLALIHGWRVGRLMPVLTSRGCPHDCSFCSVTAMFGHRYRFRSTELVLEELARSRQPCVFFYDDNFAAHPERTRQLLEGMLRLPRPLQWSAQVRADCTEDPELIDLMARAGCIRLFIGYESVSPATLETYNKRQSVEQILRSVRVLHERRIAVHGMFVLGADSDDVGSIRSTVSFAIRHALDSVQFSILTPLPGTRYYRTMEQAKRLFVRDWSRYDGDHVVFRPLQMTAATLQREVWAAYERAYSLRRAVSALAGRHWLEGTLALHAQALVRLMRLKDAAFLRGLSRA